MWISDTFDKIKEEEVRFRYGYVNDMNSLKLNQVLVKLDKKNKFELTLIKLKTPIKILDWRLHYKIKKNYPK
jgi:hypothetical protein